MESEKQPPLRFMPYRPNITDKEQAAKEKTEIRAHASLVGYHNSQRRKAKAVEANKDDTSSEASTVGSLVAAFGAALQGTGTLEVVLKTKPTLLPRQKRRSKKKSINVDYPSHNPEPKLPSIERPISVELNTPRYLHIWTQEFTSNFRGLTKCFNIRNVQAIDAIRPYLEHEVFENTLACISHALFNLRAGVDNNKSRDVLLYRGKALAALRSQLDTPQIHSATLLSMGYMVLLEMVMGNVQVSETHKKILQRLIQRNGGMNSLDEFLVSHLLQQDEYWIDIGMSPILELSPVDPATIDYPSADQLNELQGAIIHLPPGFRQLATRGELLTSNLEFLMRITQFHGDQRKSSSSSEDDTFDPRIPSGRRYRSLHDACPVLRVPDSDTVLFQKLLCLALVVYSMMCLNSPAVFTHHMLRARGELTLKLPHFPKHLTPFYHQEQCLFWIYHVTVKSWRKPTGELEPEGEALEIAQKDRFQAFYDNQQTNTMLQNFSWQTLDRIIIAK